MSQAEGGAIPSDGTGGIPTTGFGEALAGRDDNFGRSIKRLNFRRSRAYVSNDI
jgi:hypothetical protein